MRRRTVWIAAAAGLVVAAGVAVWLGRSRTGWTTASPRAAAEFDRAIAESQKLYSREALEHLERAVALDPDFVVAKASLAASLEHSDPERAHRMLEEVRAADLDRLTPREQFLVRLDLARVDGDMDAVYRLIRRYGAAHPDDPFVLYAQAQAAWREGDLRRAEPLYRRLIKVAPNWVLAYNELGYMAMGEGRFKEAEDLFVTYRFIAPDQANPHDSLGELYIVTGRYDEARTELERAIEVKPDFCAAYSHLMTLDLLIGRPEKARSVVERARASGACSGGMLDRMACVAAVAPPAQRGDWEGVWKAFTESCDGEKDSQGWAGIAACDAAAATGRWDELERIRDALAGLRREGRESALTGGMLGAEVEFVEGLLQLRGGNHAGALEHFLKADRTAGYYGTPGLLKLWLRLHIVREYRALGRNEEAERVLAEVERVNPPMAKVFREHPEHILP